jgi:hypothetical protein
MSTKAQEEDIILCTDADISRLLTDITASKCGKRNTISVSGTDRFLLWTPPVTEGARLSLQGAVEEVSNFIFSSSLTSLCLTFSVESSETKANKETFLLVAVRVSKETSNLVDLPVDVKLNQEELDDFKPRLPIFQRLWRNLSSQQLYLPLHESPKMDGKAEFRRRRLLLGLLAMLATLILVTMTPFIVNHLHLHQHSWKRYTIGTSVGPNYQLQFSHRNISSWKVSSNYNPDDWVLRIDDQSMIPKALYTSEEDHYQQWFRHRYPEKEEIRQLGLYADETFLSDPYSIQVPTDSTFHTAHCVLTLRRYWWAKESGRHVCPRDLDFRHMRHCLDSLDSLVFPEGIRGPVEPEPVDDERFLIWKTKVCFDE